MKTRAVTFPIATQIYRSGIVKIFIKSILWALLALPLLLILAVPLGAQDWLFYNDSTVTKVRVTENHTDHLIYDYDGESIFSGKVNFIDYALHNPKYKKRSVIAVKKRGGQIYYGRLLFFTQDTLFLWAGNATYDPLKGGYVKISFSEMSELALHRNGNFKRGFGIGAIIGGLIGMVTAIGGNSSEGSMGFDLEAVTPGAVLIDGITYAGAFGLLGGLISTIYNEHHEHTDFGSDELQKRLRKYAMLVTPPLPINKSDVDWSVINEADFRETKRLNKSM